MARPLYEIAADITADYADRGKNVHYAAKPYVDAMGMLTNITDTYYADDARTVVLYALSNLSSWRGETAKAVKLELKALLK